MAANSPIKQAVRLSIFEYGSDRAERLQRSNASANRGIRPMTIQVNKQSEPAPFLTAKQLADYLHLNEKKVYGLANDGSLPGTKITGKWLFPRELIDKWLMETSHGGVLADRLIVTGSDDALLHRIVVALTNRLRGRALINYTATETRLGLELLAGGRADLCVIHWGPAEESHLRHPALLRDFPKHALWVLVRAFRREQGLIVRTDKMNGAGPEALERCFRESMRWVFRQEGSGSQRFLQEAVARCGLALNRLEVVYRAASEREAVSLLLRDEADVVPGARSTATEFSLGFIPAGWEAVDLVLPRAIYFRHLFQEIQEEIGGEAIRHLATELGGYDFSGNGQVVWSH